MAFWKQFGGDMFSTLFYNFILSSSTAICGCPIAQGGLTAPRTTQHMEQLLALSLQT